MGSRGTGWQLGEPRATDPVDSDGSGAPRTAEYPASLGAVGAGEESSEGAHHYPEPGQEENADVGTWRWGPRESRMVNQSAGV